MSLKIFLDSQPKGYAADLSRKLGFSESYLSQMKSGKVIPNPKLAIKIEGLTGVPRNQLRPDDWQDQWPEYVPPAQPASPTPTGLHHA